MIWLRLHKISIIGDIKIRSDKSCHLYEYN